MSIRTPLAKVKHLGSAHSGTQHFIHQRVTALFMIPLMMWFVYSILTFILLPIDNVPEFVTSPVNVIASILFVGTFLYHGTLGMRVIIEDYIHCKWMQNAMLIGLHLLSIVTFISGVVALLSIHFIFRIAL